MNTSNRLGATSAFTMAAAYIFGLSMALTVLDTSGLDGPVEVVAFVVANSTVYYVWITAIYVVAGCSLVPLTLVLHDRISSAGPEHHLLARVATAFGIIWAALVIGSGLLHNVGLLKLSKLFADDPEQAAAFWRVIHTVHVGVGASIEVPGGLWTLLIGVAGLRARQFPPGVNTLAIVVGAAGVASVIPALLEGAVAIYALGQILWWVALGVCMLRRG